MQSRLTPAAGSRVRQGYQDYVLYGEHDFAKNVFLRVKWRGHLA